MAATNELAGGEDGDRIERIADDIDDDEDEKGSTTKITLFTEVKLNEIQEEKQTNNNNSSDNLTFNNANISTNNHNNNNINNNNFRKPTLEEGSNRKSNIRKGWVRHLVAILALSSIVLANMNRQAFNQALVSSMTKRSTNKTDAPVNNSTELSHDATTINSISRFETTTTTTQPEITTTTYLPAETTTILMGNVTSPADTDHFLDNNINLNEYSDLDEDKFDWSGAQIATLQAAFSYGYTPFMIPGGRMSELYGAKWVVFISGFGSALCCIFSPLFADTNYKLLVASRVVMGLCQTGVSPALYALLTRWLPPEESSVYLPMIKVGVMVGFMSGSLVGGFFTWRITFYVVGLIGIFWSTMWAFTVSSDPNEHRFISKRELNYIKGELQRANKGRAISMDAARKAAAPWLRILTNPVVLAFMLAKFTVKLSTDAQTMQIPMYLNNVFKVSQELNGLLSALNFAIQGIFTGLVAWSAKEFVVKKAFGLNKTGVRRLFQGICNFGMALAYVLITCNMSSLSIVCCAVVLLSIAAMFGAGGEAVTPVDLSTDYSASIMAIANSAANFSGILLPSLVSFVLADQLGSSQRWNMVWWIVGGITMVGGLIYTCRVEAEIQDFTSSNEVDSHGERKNEKFGSKQNKESLMSIEMKSTYKKKPFDNS